MEPIRILAFRERYTCRRGHTLDVWVRPRARDMLVEPMVHCPHCGTLFVLTMTTQHPSWSRSALDRADDTCPTCQAPVSDTRPYPDRPACRACAAQLRTWLTDGPDLPASAASVIRGWALHRSAVDLTTVTIPAQLDLASRARASR
jgi:endogenous inhibitor of DNA gyrase (YacG/DUF329 family)